MCIMNALYAFVMVSFANIVTFVDILITDAIFLLLQQAKDEFTLDLVEQCSFHKQRVMHLAVTSR